MKKNISNILTCLLFLQTLLFQVDLPDLVLCFGDDGHIAIEKSKKTDCVREDGTYNLANNIYRAYDQNHSDCNDVTLDLHFSDADIQKTRSSHFLTHMQQPTPLLLDQKSTTYTINLSQKSFQKQTQNIISNTILII
jgi:hypothetical protein